MAVTLLRHTLPAIDLKTCYGRQDVDVAHSFIEEAAAAAATLHPPDKIISSPLQRCQKLARFVAETFSMQSSVDIRLQEMDFGLWEGQFWQDIPAHELETWRQDFLNARPHQGESVQMLNDRVASVLEDYRDRSEAVLFVTHAGVIKSARYLTQQHRAEFDWSESIGFGEHLALV